MQRLFVDVAAFLVLAVMCNVVAWLFLVELDRQAIEAQQQGRVVPAVFVVGCNPPHPLLCGGPR